MAIGKGVARPWTMSSPRGVKTTAGGVEGEKVLPWHQVGVFLKKQAVSERQRRQPG